MFWEKVTTRMVTSSVHTARLAAYDGGMHGEEAYSLIRTFIGFSHTLRGILCSLMTYDNLSAVSTLLAF